MRAISFCEELQHVAAQDDVEARGTLVGEQVEVPCRDGAHDCRIDLEFHFFHGSSIGNGGRKQVKTCAC